MSAEAAAFSRSWPVGPYTATLTVPSFRSGQAQAVIEWSPQAPVRLTAAELRQYRQGRSCAIAELSDALGLRIAVLDL